MDTRVDDIDRFLGFLGDTSMASNAALLRVRRAFEHGGDQRVGQIAGLRGYLKANDVLTLVKLQGKTDLPFGELAVRESLLTQSQVDELLTMQSKPYLQALEVLRSDRAIPAERASELVRDFETRYPDRNAPATGKVGVRASLRAMGTLSAMSTVVQRALQQLDATGTQLDGAAKTIEADPALAAQVLRLASSAFFGSRRTIATVRSAIMTLGTNNVRQVLLTASVMDRFRAADAKPFWIASIRCGQWARALWRETAREPTEDAFTAGLLTDIGRLAVLELFRGESRTIEARVVGGAPRAIAEREAIGLTHQDVGALLCHEWQFASQLTEAVQYHHAPPASLAALGVGDIAQIVNAAARLADMPRSGDPTDMIGLLDEDFFEFHGVTAASLIALVPTVARDTAELASLLL